MMKTVYVKPIEETLRDFRYELRVAMGDKARLTKLHSIVTDNINRSFGENKDALVKFRQELRNAMNSGVRFT